MTRPHPLDRAAIALGLASIASLVFVYEGLDEFRFLAIGGPSIAVALVLGALAAAAGLTGRRVPALLAGLGFAAAAALELASTLAGEDWLGANLSTMSLWLGLAVGLLLAAAAPRTGTDTAGTEPPSH
ncbi:Rv1678 family membrane protein [Glycomyces salinus]|uniref:Rv1678 family membrane protein n=1 Tax=Glycomyces salinus TaxID=980294 RepID=UPI0018EA72F0|nr:hypothetical protein [Glycomyces salinus]